MVRTPSYLWVFGVAAVGVQLGATAVLGDDLLDRYEGDVHPLEAGWLIGNPCEAPCTEAVEGGHLVFRWAEPADLVGYASIITEPSAEPPPTLWIEWRFRSNEKLGIFSGCDGAMNLHYRSVSLVINMFADAAVDMSGIFLRRGLAVDEFHLYRFESLDGALHSVAIDGQPFFTDLHPQPGARDRLLFLGSGGCRFDARDIVNEWDFIRYGTISSGEKVVSSDPPAGFVDARTQPALDRFTVTFDSANYVYVNDITVEATGVSVPIVTATRRLDNGEPDTVEIVLDRPIPFGETTRFTMTDGVATNIVEYTFAPGDANGNGKVDLFDAAVLQNCFGEIDPIGLCAVADLTHDDVITLDDFALLSALFDGP